MRLNSLALRLFLSATTWTVVILLVTGVVLSSIYRTAVERAFDRRLGVYLRSLVADVATPEENAGKFPQSIGEPLFDLPLSGWYWQVTRLDAPTPDVRSSRSLWDATLPHLTDLAVSSVAGAEHGGYAEGPEGQQLRVVERTIDLGEEGRYLVAVAGDAAEIEEETHSFDSALVITFGVLAAVLLLTTTFQGAFPVEIAPLARETNALIDANREIVVRARTHVGNLAHALKTPISVMLNEANTHGGDPFALKVREQTEIMGDQVARHLERARLAAGVAVIGTVTDVRMAVTALARTMAKIHHDRNVAVDIDAPEGVRFRGEQQDLEEMVGNLVDNAYKWAQSRVAVEVFAQRPDANDDRRIVHILVDDDGPGLSPQQREQVARRGRRLDETKPGSGLGLSIVVELAGLYGGELTLGTAPIGGLRAELILPGA
jgi:signal transduction histidine kinase